jgi:HPt (histidine-containing phosphotransfer) domain-containing protein
MDTTPTFEPLRKLFRGDTERIRHALEVFERITRQDLDRMDYAYATQNWTVMGRLAHRMRSGCHQIGETDAVEKLAGIERATSFTARAETDAFAMEFAIMRQELERVMTRVNEYLQKKDGDSI